MSRKSDVASILYNALIKQGQTGVYAMELIADYNQEIANEFYAQYLEQPKAKQNGNFAIELGKYTPSETPSIEWYQVTAERVSIGGIKWQDRYICGGLMTEELPVDLNIGQLLIAILDTVKSIDIKTVTFLNAASDTRQIAVDYNEEESSFTFRLKDIEDEAI